MKGPGIDVSKWQGDFDFVKARAEGFEFAVIRAGCGAVTDPMFEKNYARAKAAGMNAGAYWYTYAQSAAQAEREADCCFEVIKGKKLELPVYIDIEDKSVLNCGRDTATKVVKAFCNQLASKGYFVGVYSSLSMFKNRLNDSELQGLAHWVACWARECNYPNTHCFGMWQYGGETNLIRSNKVAGKTVDQNYMLVDYPKIIKEKGLNGYTFDKHDINKDGKVNSKDLVVEMKAVASGEADSTYDLNSDGKVNSKDAVAVMKKLSN